MQQEQDPRRAKTYAKGTEERVETEEVGSVGNGTKSCKLGYNDRGTLMSYLVSY